MMAWVFYDIGEDHARSRVASQCLNHGLVRVQKSVFCGEISPSTLRELEEKVREILAEPGEEGDGGVRSVLFLTVCEKCLANVTSAGRPFSPEDVRYPRLVIIG
ncbi:MAG: CRISPR-associated endonuclease Cas2 [Methanolinea sp.]|nr:CRISPR-associated endonuclease Cas2 [Methanolinea sp.]